jgi:hypothetical protein
MKVILIALLGCIVCDDTVYAIYVNVLPNGDFTANGTHWVMSSDYPSDITATYYRPAFVNRGTRHAFQVYPGQCCTLADIGPDARGFKLQQSVLLEPHMPYLFVVGYWQLLNYGPNLHPLSEELVVRANGEEIVHSTDILPLYAPHVFRAHSTGGIFEAPADGIVSVEIEMKRWDLTSSVAHILDDLSIVPLPICSLRRPPPTGATNLILITHGWQGDINWVNNLKDSITSLISQRQTNPSDWQIVAYDWTDHAGGTPDDALARAVEHGNCLGEQIANNRYASIHAIGHSAGSALVNALVEKVELASPETFTHLTFLDAYTPGEAGETYGREADFTEHYFNRGDSLWLDWTEAILPHAHNVDVTALDPTPTPSRPDLGHAWPHEWYDHLTAPIPGTRQYGFNLSHAAGNDQDLAAVYPLGQAVVLEVPPMGDANEDMVVNRYDLGAIARGFGAREAALWQQGDFNGDGQVTLEDLVIYRNSQGVPQLPAPLVPEPSAIILLCFGSLPLLRNFPRRK